MPKLKRSRTGATDAGLGFDSAVPLRNLWFCHSAIPFDPVDPLPHLIPLLCCGMKEFCYPYSSDPSEISANTGR